VATTLFVGMLVRVVTAIIFGALALTVDRRRVHPAARPANTMFALWWWAIGLQQLLTAVRTGLWSLGLPLSLHVGLSLVSTAALLMGLAGLLYYLIYLYTGRALLLWPLIGAYAASFVWWFGRFAALEPIDVVLDDLTIRFVFGAPPSQELLLGALAFLVGPQLLACVAIVVLAFRLPASAARVRLTVVAVGVVLWFGSSVAVMFIGVDGIVWDVVRLFAAPLVGVSVLLAYAPPPWLARHLPADAPSRETHRA